MPELPEVETIRRQLAERLPGRTISRAAVEDALLVSPEDPAAFSGQVPRGGRVESPRWGAGEVPAGGARFRRHAGHAPAHDRPPALAAGLPGGPGDDGERFLRARFDLDDGSTVTFGDMRGFGRLDRARDAGGSRGLLGGAGRDRAAVAGLHGPRAGAAARRPAGAGQGRAAQPGAGGGLGNMYVDEALFQARIHPERPAGSLDDDEIRRLHRAIRDRLAAAVEAGGASIDSYRDSLGQRGSMQDLLRVHLHEGDPARAAERRSARPGWPSAAPTGARPASRSRRRGERGAGVRVGHWTDAAAGTGCTVVLPPPGTVGGGGGARRGARHARHRPAAAAGLGAGRDRAGAERRQRVRARGGDRRGPLVRGARASATTPGRPACRVVPAACIYDLGIAADGAGPARTRATPPARPLAPGSHAVGSVGAGTGRRSASSGPAELVQGRPGRRRRAASTTARPSPPWPS